ncbi:CRE-CUTL-27 protein, partial [Aphelenchoides avenae]
KNRCTSGRRIEFAVTKNAEVYGLSVAMGTLSVRNCMRECITSGTVFCQAFDYDRTTRECFLGVESAALSPKSDRFDLYEPFCISDKVDVPCLGPYVFDRIPNATLGAAGVLKHLIDVSVDLCMEHCLLSDACMAFTFDRPERNCKLLEQSQRDLQSRVDPHPSADYYELACERKAIFRSTELTSSGTGTSGSPFTSTQPQTTLPPSRDASLSALSIAAERAKVGTSLAPVIGKSACDTEHGMLVEKGRTLRLEFRNIHRVNVRTLRQCEELCAKTAIKCATFAYSPRSRDCLLSSSSIDRNSRFAVITQASQSFDLYAFLGSACIL